MGRRRRPLGRPLGGGEQLSTQDTTRELVGQAADELYGLPPEDFTAARDEKVRAAREAGDRPLATALAKLRKPTVSAWVLNLLVRDQPEVGEQLAELGADLRQAQETLSGAALKELSAQRQRLVSALVRSARRIAAREGHQVTQAVSFELEQTLHAALADPAVAAQVGAGRLVRATSRTGLETADSEPANHEPVAEPEKPARPRLRVVRDPGEDPKVARERRRREEEQARLRDEWQAAERTRAEADEDVEDLEGRLEDAERELATAAEEVEELARRLGEAEAAERDANRREREARRERDAAVRRRDSAARRAADLATRLAELDEPPSSPRRS
ncbi:MAG TPA: hypothetical protein VF109_08415 [Mycobacteriales bacterium]